MSKRRDGSSSWRTSLPTSSWLAQLSTGRWQRWLDVLLATTLWRVLATLPQCITKLRELLPFGIWGVWGVPTVLRCPERPRHHHSACNELSLLPRCRAGKGVFSAMKLGKMRPPKEDHRKQGTSRAPTLPWRGESQVGWGAAG